MEKKLLDWALRNSSPASIHEAVEGANSSSNLDQEVIDAILGKPDSLKMKECLAVITNKAESLENRTIAFDNFELLVENLDNANDLEPLGLWPSIIGTLRYVEGEGESVMRKYGAWVIGTALQNNPKSQDAFLSHGGVEVLLDRLKLEEETEVKIKLLYALSGSIKHHDSSLKRFIEAQGLEYVASQLSDIKMDARIMRRYLYLIHGICLTNPGSLSADQQTKMVPLLCNLMKGDQDDVEIVEKSLEILTLVMETLSKELQALVRQASKEIPKNLDINTDLLKI